MPPKSRGPSPPRHSITTVARLTGLSAETLRVWERQYQVVQPVGGARGSLYSGNDVKRLQLLAAAGRGPGLIAGIELLWDVILVRRGVARIDAGSFDISEWSERML